MIITQAEKIQLVKCDECGTEGKKYITFDKPQYTMYKTICNECLTKTLVKLESF